MTISSNINLGRGLCFGGAGLGAIGLTGYLTGADALVTIVPGEPPMMPNTALALLLLGIAGALRGSTSLGPVMRSLSVLAAGFVLLFGLVILAEYAWNLPFSVDHLLFSIDRLLVRAEAGAYPGRPSPPTALALALLAAAIPLWDWRAGIRIPAEWLIVFAGLIAFAAMMGQAFGVGALYQIVPRPVIGVAVHTALGLLLISLGMLLERPGSRLARTIRSPEPGDIMLRRLAFPLILITVSIGYAGALLSERLGSRDAALIAASLTVIGIVAGLLLLAITAASLNRAHEALERSQARTRELIELASDGIFIFDLDGRLTEVNQAGCRLYGYSREEILNKTIKDFVLPEDEERLWRHRDRLLAGHTEVAEWTALGKDGERLPVEVSAKILPDGRWQGIVRDISERKRAEDALRQAHERVELALRGGDLATWDWDVKTGEVIYNRRWANLRGLRPEEIVSSLEAWSKGVHPEDWPVVQNRVRDCLEGRQPEFECEYRVATKTGEWIWVLDRGKVVERDEHGKPTRMAGTELDLTARKRAEQQLEHDLDAMTRLQKLGALSAQAGNLEPVLTEIVDAAIAISGSDFGNIQLLDPVSGDLRIAVQRNFPPWWVEFWNSVTRGKGACGTALARGARVMIEDVDQSPIFAGTPALEIQRKAGVRSVQSVPLISRSGRTIGMLSTHYRTPHRPDSHMFRLFDLLAGQAADIIEHAQAEEALRLSQAKFSGIVSISPDAIISIDENQKITLFNEGAEKIFGRPRADMIGLPLDVLIPERFRAAHAREVEAFASGTEATRRVGARGSEIFGLRRNGQEFPADAAISRIVVGGRRILTVALRDITELKEAEAEARRATKAREDVLGIVAHDLRNPLAAIVALAATMKRKGSEREISEEIASAANRMDRLIGDLLDVTRIESGRFSLRQERLPTAELLSDALEGQLPIASAAALELHLDAPSGLPDIWADRDRILQVFENLIGNAIKFTKPGGHITLGATVRGDNVMFSIADTGCGIPESHLPHVFDRFWQAPGASRRGLGFGLAIVKGIVETHRGSIWVESRPGRGSTFFFTIPVAQLAQSARRPRRYQAVM